MLNYKSSLLGLKFKLLIRDVFIAIATKDASLLVLNRTQQHIPAVLLLHLRGQARTTSCPACLPSFM